MATEETKDFKETENKQAAVKPSAENDFATQSMLKWFVDEQVEEEENAQTIIDNLKMIKDNGYGLYMLDKELGARTYTQASPLSSSAE